MSQRIVELFSSSVIVQGLLSLLLVATFCYQEIISHSVDTDLKLITFGVVGFWLGGKAVLQAQQLTRKAIKHDE